MWNCPVVKIDKIEKHPNADKLGIVTVEGTICLVQLDIWKEGDLAVLVPIDSIVPLSDPNFAFLAKANQNQTEARIKAVRLRGIFSDGILVPVPKTKWYQRRPKLGQDVSKLIGARKFEEEAEPVPSKLNLVRRFIFTYLYAFLRLFGYQSKERSKYLPPPRFKYSNGDERKTYELEKYAKYRIVLEGAEVAVTEKLHGSHISVHWENDKAYVASRNVVGPPDKDSVYCVTAAKYGLVDKMSKLPGISLHGEVLGVQDLLYGHTKDDPGFVAFDMYDIKNRRFLNYDEFVAKCKELDIPTVPLLYRGPFDADLIDKLVNHENDKKIVKSKYDGKTLQEGAVVKPVVETRSPYCGRVALKLVSKQYLLRQKGTEFH